MYVELDADSCTKAYRGVAGADQRRWSFEEENW